LEEELNAVHDTEEPFVSESFSAQVEADEEVLVEEEMSAPEAFFAPEESEETAVFEENAVEEPENAFPAFSAHLDESMNGMEELNETEQHSFDATTGDLDQNLIASEPAAAVFEDITADVEAETEVAMHDETEGEPTASYFTESSEEGADEPAASYFADSSEEEEEAQPAPSFFDERSEVEEEVQANTSSYFEEIPEVAQAPDRTGDHSRNVLFWPGRYRQHGRFPDRNKTGQRRNTFCGNRGICVFGRLFRSCRGG
jgi:hypothetical protein